MNASFPKEELKKMAKRSLFHYIWLMTICHTFLLAVCLQHASSLTWASLQWDVSPAVSQPLAVQKFIEHFVWFGQLISWALWSSVFHMLCILSVLPPRVSELQFLASSEIYFKLWENSIYILSSEKSYNLTKMLLLSKVKQHPSLSKCMKRHALCYIWLWWFFSHYKKWESSWQ